MARGALLPYCQKSVHSCSAQRFQHTTENTTGIQWERAWYTDQAASEPTTEDSILAMRNVCNTPEAADARHRDSQGLQPWMAPRLWVEALIAQ
jgi:hypothetical protein